MTITETTAVPTLEEFSASAREFLEREALGRRTHSVTATTRNVSLFRASTVADADAARAWQGTAYDAGFAWITGPTSEGGRGLPPVYERTYQRIEREFETVSRTPLGVSLGMVAPTLAQFGSDEARGTWLRALYRGEAVGCQLFSEPGAGSDLAAVATTARNEGDHWVVSGQKVWTSGAHYSDVGLLLAKTSDGPSHQNLTAFLVDISAPGVEVRPLRQMTGEADFNEVFLDDVRIPDSARLGEVDAGWGVAIATLMYERGAIGGAVGGGSGLFSMTLLADWLRSLGVEKDPLVRQAFGRVHVGVTSAKVMRQRVEAAVKAGEAPGPEMSFAKLALVRNLMLMAEVVRTALGPELVFDSGRDQTFDWAEFVLGVPGMRLGGGTDEVQRNIIAKRVLRLPQR